MKVSRKKRRKRLVWIHVKSPICEVYGWHPIDRARKILVLTLDFSEEHFNSLAIGASSTKSSVLDAGSKPLGSTK